MGKVLGQTVLQQAEKEVKQKKSKPKNLIKLCKEAESEDKPKAKYSLENDDSERGVICLSHIPHGFYEEQIKKFFRQFGQVLKVRVARSKRSGRSRGYAYVLFEHVSVAKVAADAMNNYLMCGRLIKANFVPKEKQNMFLFYGSNYHQSNYPRLRNVKKIVQDNHKKVKQSRINKKNAATKIKLAELEKTLKSKGVNLSLVTV